MSIWPPPPDLESLKELFAAADVEGLIADECPLDEYDPEARHFYEVTLGLPATGFTAQQTIPILERLWARQFSLSEQQLVQRQPALTKLAEQIARFFGPQAQPQVPNPIVTVADAEAHSKRPSHAPSYTPEAPH